MGVQGPGCAAVSYVPILRRAEDPLETIKVNGNRRAVEFHRREALPSAPRARSRVRGCKTRERGVRSGRAATPFAPSPLGGWLRAPATLARARERTAGGIARNRSGVFSPRAEFGPRVPARAFYARAFCAFLADAYRSLPLSLSLPFFLPPRST